uniref:Uncharacterized protein n=1 Tax=viral metagenome TaxID=1070528 RepID=A0A6M3IKM6_9ZZZZ
MDEDDYYAYPWLSDDEWSKLSFRVRSQLNAILNPLRAYGQGVYVEGAIEEILVLIDKFGQVVRGKDIPVLVRESYAPLPTE